MPSHCDQNCFESLLYVSAPFLEVRIPKMAGVNPVRVPFILFFVIN